MYIKELLSEYGIKSTKTLYSRLDALGIKLSLDESGKAFATAEQIALLDEQDKHLKAGGTLANFIPTLPTSIEPQHTPLHTDNLDTVSDTAITTLTTQHGQHTPLSAELLGDIIARVMESIEPKDPLYYMVILERAIASQWILSTSEVEELIKVRPYTKKGNNVFIRGCFRFIKCGKVGSEIGWKVSKLIENIPPYKV